MLIHKSDLVLIFTTCMRKNSLCFSWSVSPHVAALCKAGQPAKRKSCLVRDVTHALS